jgi:hypothetical protein
MQPTLAPIDLHPVLGAYLLKYAGRSFLISALKQEDMAQSRDAGIDHETGLEHVLNNLDLQELRMLAYETASSNLRPSDPLRDHFLRIDRDGVFVVTQLDVHLTKMVHTLQGLARAIGTTEFSTINTDSVAELLGAKGTALALSNKHFVHRTGARFSIEKSVDDSATRRYLVLLENQYTYYKSVTTTLKAPDRHAITGMGIE